MGRRRRAWLVHEGAEIALVDSFLADLFDHSIDGLGATLKSDSSARSRDAC
jgi:hypothetical protein